ncbi:hypothetical protein SAMN06295945_0995 [Polynucleobacter meluiroseus]|uniref:Uncharacterized protein n=1 Tax=Polynucleobacter meluiroseus TaxID=1938814 RepID=A0A240DZP2_9BURK|nr:hypothetical protein SAMN06295945_0995 [Polynucleobacter meluiroseus]
MSVQMIELEEVQMVEASDESLEVAGGGYIYGVKSRHKCVHNLFSLNNLC